MKQTKSKTIEQLFPHSNFGYRVEYKDGNDNKICWFCHPSHVEKYFAKYHIDPSVCVIDVHPDYPPLSEKEQPVKKTRAKKQDKVFADVDTYVKITDKPKRSRKAAAPAPEAPPEAPKRTRKAPAKASKGTAAPEAPKRRSRSKK